MPKTLKILTEPNPALRKKSKDVVFDKMDGKKMSRLADDMVETMIKKDGIGLAAPQIGQNIRAIVINTKEGPVIMINPVLADKSLLKELGEEGCLSLPHIFGQVKRHKRVTCRFSGLDGKPFSMKAEGLMARVIQHEIDHLDGVLFIDKAKNITHHVNENK